MASLDRSFLDQDIHELTDKLSTEDLISLLGAPNWWNTHSIPRLNVPSVRMSDGPNGVRGSSHFLSSPATCIPCATSLGATFDPSLIHSVGEFLASEAHLKSSVILLAPTCNIQRSPLGGRAFESFSEDPHLSGTLAAAYVNGLQSKGVAATIKHFVANDQESERTAADSVMSERALREVYLYPFMIAQRDAKPWAYMTSYGRIDNVHCAENPRLLQDILRDEWKFDGLVMSDWFGTYSVSEALNAGLDLEMPGPPRWRTPLLVNHLLSAQKLLPSTLATRAQTLLSFVQKVAKAAPEVVYGDGEERVPKATKETRDFLRKLAAEGAVLLKNDKEVLPLNKENGLKSLAVIGPNAKGRVISGGGSAYLKASYIVSPWEGIVTQAEQAGIKVEHAVGCYAHKYLPTLEDRLQTPSGEAGWLCTFYNNESSGTTPILSSPVATFVLNDTRVKLNDFLPPGLTDNWTIHLVGSLDLSDFQEDGFEFGLTVSGRAKLYVNDKLLVDNWTKQTPGEFFYGQGTVEEKAVLKKTQNKVNIRVEYVNSSPPNGGEKDLSQPALMKGVRLGGAPKIDPSAALASAVALAKASDVAIVVVGLTHEWESEGSDRPSLALPGAQADLIRRVAEVNKKTVVVVQAGSAVDLSFSPEVASLIQAWYSGNEVGNAIADVLFGRVNPSGRLPLTLPNKEVDIPAWLNRKSENGKIHYREDVFVGYKGYEGRGVEPAFAFGYGLSYTTFSYSSLQLATPSVDPSSKTFRLVASLTVTNTGRVLGSAVTQLYVSLPSTSSITHPYKQLRAFVKTHDLQPGESRKVELTLDKYAVSYWLGETNGKWVVEAGEYGVLVGGSSRDEDLNLKATFQIKQGQGFNWRGL